MTASSPTTSPAHGWTVAPASRGLASRLVAGFLHVSTGLVLAAAVLGLGLGAIAGIVLLVIAATGDKGYVDAVNLAMTFIVMGIVLAVSARAADWNTHGPVAES